MSLNPSRRTVSQGLAWSVPAVAAAAAAPAFAASSTVCSWESIRAEYPAYCPTDAGLRADYFDPKIFGPTYGSDFGVIQNAQTRNNWGFKNTSACPLAYAGSVSLTFRNDAGESSIPAPTVTLTGRTVYTGYANAGNVVTGGAIAGFRGATTFTWNNSTGSASKNWAGAVVRVPYEFSYTDSAGRLHVGMMELTFTLAGFTAALTPHTDLRSYTVATTPAPPASTCAALNLTP